MGMGGNGNVESHSRTSLHMTYAILLISPGRWQQPKIQQRIGVVGLIIITLSMSMITVRLELSHTPQQWV